MNDASDEWERTLRTLVGARSIVLVKLSDEEFDALRQSRNGLSEFTLTYPHALLTDIVPPCLCLVIGKRVDGYGPRSRGKEFAFAAALKSKLAVASLQTRIKIERVGRVTPALSKLPSQLSTARFSSMLRSHLKSPAPLLRLSPKLSTELLGILLAEDSNRGALRVAAVGLRKKTSEANERIQSDAIQTALKAFGLTSDAQAAQLDLVRGRESSLTGARIMEDAVIEHDARSVPGYELASSDVTGRATFRRGAQTLEVFTANRRKLEEVFGVDLIYLNRYHDNVVMVQYKMLEPAGDSHDDEPDWIYAQDRHLSKQIAAMKRFIPTGEYSGAFRLSRDFFYFKFVHRHAGSARASLLMPLAHLEELKASVGHQGRTGGLRLSYKALGGRYMRQTAFFSLLQAGYIGADCPTTHALETLINDLLDGGDSLVIALQRETTNEEEELDRERRARLYQNEDSGLF